MNYIPRLVAFGLIYVLLLAHSCKPLPAGRTMKNIKKAGVNSRNVLPITNHNSPLLIDQQEFYKILLDDLKTTSRDNPNSTNTKCLDVSDTCLASSDCCGYPSNVCVLYVSGSSYDTFCSPRWLARVLTNYDVEKESNVADFVGK